MSESKSILAKLMATENLVVEHKNIPTAMFDVQGRVLYLPIWKDDLPIEVTNLLISHEVGHALYTPLEGMHSTKDENDVLKGYINIIEDCRIEKKIKLKYPGVRPDMIKGYNHLMENDFFGVKNVNLNKLSFIDRINLYYKGSFTLNIQFSNKELPFITRINNLETFDEVVSLSKDIYDFCMDDMIQTYMSNGNMEENENNENSSDESQSQQEPYDKSQSQQEPYDESQSQQDSHNDGAMSNGELNDNFSNSEMIDELTEEITSKTDRMYQENVKSLVSDDNIDYVYLNVPKYNYDDYIDGYEYNFGILKNYYDNYMDNYPTIKSYVDTHYPKFKRQTEKVVSYLIKEFEMKKSADNYSKIKVSKTGKIDMNKIFSYQFNDDVFLKTDIIPDGKNHGLIMFVDNSGSMTYSFKAVIEQILTLVLFCRKVNIPFRVFNFGDFYVYGKKHNHYVDRIYRTDLKEYLSKFNHYDVIPGYSLGLKEIFSHEMNSKEFNDMFYYMYIFSLAFKIIRGDSFIDHPNEFNLMGTPLNDAILVSKDIIKDFKKNNNIQILNTIFLTDGDSHDNVIYTHPVMDNLTYNVTNVTSSYGKKHILRDVYSKKEYTVTSSCKESSSKIYLDLLRDYTGCININYHLVSKNIKRYLNYKYGYQYEVEDMVSNFKKNKFLKLDDSEFDVQFIMPDGNNLSIDDDEFSFDGDITKKAQLKNAFLKYNKNKHFNKLFLNKFIEVIT